MEKNNIPTPVSWKLAEETLHTKKRNNITVGVLAVQGDFLEHIQALQRIGIATTEVKLPADLEAIDGIILPGGESTTIAKLLDVFNLREPLKKKIAAGMLAWGTCAGMILLAKKLVQDKPVPLGIMDIVVDRNAYGRQIDSFEATLTIRQLGNTPITVDFIRAPKIEKLGPKVEILAVLEDKTIVAVKENNILATAFHPELGGDTRFHEFFVSLVEEHKKQLAAKVTE